MELTRTIKVDRLDQIEDVKVRAEIYINGHCDVLLVNICDSRLGEEDFYEIEFNVDWMGEEKQDWLAYVMTGVLWKTINDAQNNIRLKYQKNITNMRKLAMVR